MTGLDFSVREITSSPEGRAGALDLIDTHLEQINRLPHPNGDYFERTGIELILGAYSGDRLLGISTAKIETAIDDLYAKNLVIAHVVVDGEAFERKGVGTALVGRLERVAELTGMHSVRLAATSDVVEFYEKLNYKVDETTGWYYKNIFDN
jgi:GNAT superfamily N-acetyltransferase